MRHAFRDAARRAVGDERLAAAIAKTVRTLETKRAQAVAACPGFEELRAFGRERKLEVSGSLRAYAERFAERASARGAVVHWAGSAADVGRVAAEVAREAGATTAVKAKSMTAEEAGLNEGLAEAGVSVTETDLGEFIIQLAGEKPSHILAPAIHRDRFQVAELFADALPPTAALADGRAARELSVEELVGWAREALRARFLAADLGITGGNFAVAETGTLVLVTNEGNGRMATTLPRRQLSVVGVEKVIPALSDLPRFLALLTRSASGQAISSYVTMVTGPRRPGEEEGPEELHVILLDHGRTAVADGPYREMLHCLRCGSCLTHCPVYRAVGGHAYDSTYAGPMGTVLSTLLWGRESYPELPDACTLCGRCAEVCPVKIPLPDFHRRLRQEGSSRGVFSAAGAAASVPALYRAGLSAARALLRRPDLARRLAPLRAWTTCRALPEPKEAAPFRRWWRERSR